MNASPLGDQDEQIDKEAHHSTSKISSQCATKLIISAKSHDSSSSGDQDERLDKEAHDVAVSKGNKAEQSR
jgi:predicted HicB family RNase H-like nuclease